MLEQLALLVDRRHYLGVAMSHTHCDNARKRLRSKWKRCRIKVCLYLFWGRRETHRASVRVSQ